MINSAISSRGWLNVPVITHVVPVIAESLVFSRFDGWFQARLFQPCDQVAIVRFLKKLMNARADHFADVWDPLEFLGRRIH